MISQRTTFAEKEVLRFLNLKHLRDMSPLMQDASNTTLCLPNRRKDLHAKTEQTKNAIGEKNQ